ARAAREDVLALHRNAQRLLAPITVVNPYARELTFLDARTRTRRDHEKYLTLIDTVAFLHQHQRAPQTVTRDGRTLTYLEVTPADITVANRLAAAVLGRALDDLPPQARKLLGLLTQMVRDIATRERVAPRAVHFTRRTVRHFTGWTDFQVRAHLGQLQTLEYVCARHGARGQLYVYALLYGEDDSAPRGLQLRAYDANIEGSADHVEHRPADNEGAPRGDRAPVEPPVRAADTGSIACGERALLGAAAATARTSTNGTHGAHGAHGGRDHTLPEGIR